MGKGYKERQGSTCYVGLFNGCLEKQCCGVPFEHLLQFASLCCCDKHHEPKITWGWNGLFYLTGPSWKEVRARYQRKKRRQKLVQRSWRSAASWLLFHTQAHLPRGHDTHGDWALQQKSLLKKKPLILPQRSVWCGVFLIEVPCFPMAPTCIKLTKKEASTLLCLAQG